MKKILITSALPYANGPLHFGHIAGAYLPGDCYARFERLQGNDVLYLCGSDEYGVAITLSAELAGRTPKEHVDLFHEVNKNFFSHLNFSFDHYSRTTCEEHQAPVHQFFNDLLNNGYIEQRKTEQLFSPQENRFLADRYVVGTCPRCSFENARGDECPKCGASFDATELKNPRSKMTGAPLVLKETTHWFLLLEKFQEKLKSWLSEKNWKPNVVKFIQGYIEHLHARAITRDSNWGVPLPLPNTSGKVLYVWFDAPIGYISSAMEWAKKKGEPDLWKKYWLDQDTKLVHFIGKDNIPFHAAIFPAMIMGQNTPYKLVDELPANEFYMLEGKQFSKSDGWYIDLQDFFTRYTADQIRYAIAANAPESADSEFSWKDFQMRCNVELLGKFGNFINRVLVFAKNHTQNNVPKMAQEAQDNQFLDQAHAIVNEAKESYANFRLRRASQLIMELAALGNGYFDLKKPWKEANTLSVQITIACCLECIKLLALIASPIMPETAQKVWQMLNLEGVIEKGNWDAIKKTPLKEGQSLGEAKILFQKIEDDQIEAELIKLKKQGKEKSMIGIEEVEKLDLRVGVILEAQEVEKSKKLLQLKVDIGGGEIRTILSGIKGSYTKEAVLGKKVVVIANLKPAKLMGIESQGMILAASNQADLELVTLDNLPPGSIVS
jgi:methionyl-tRNA synthetase